MRITTRLGWGTVTALLGLLLGTSIAPVEGQQVKATLVIHMDHLSEVKQIELRDFKQVLQDYIENHTWVDEVGFELRFFLEAYLQDRSSGVEDRYYARLTVSNQQDVKYEDREWRFSYQQDEVLYHDEYRFHPLTWLLDYYVYLLIGHEMDRRGLLEGTPAFQKAQAICEEAKYSDYYRGWERRIEWVEQILAEENKPFRRVRALFQRALLLDASGNNPGAKELGREIVQILSTLLRKHPDRARYRGFINVNYLELAKLFRTDTTPETYEQLVRIDPAHAETYQAYIGKIEQAVSP